MGEKALFQIAWVHDSEGARTTATLIGCPMSHTIVATIDDWGLCCVTDKECDGATAPDWCPLRKGMVMLTMNVS